jgi:hypothetical protein
MASTAGPTFTGRFEEFVVNGESGEQYTILYLADRNNDELQSSGQAPAYYWMPGEVRLARKGDVGDFKFHHIHFAGVFDEEVNVGIAAGETQGGILTFTVTSRYPTAILKQAEEQLLAKFRGSDEPYWGWRTPVAPRFAIAPIVANSMAVSNVVPAGDGSTPTLPAGAGPGAGAPRLVTAPRMLINPRSVPHGPKFRGPTALDPWGFRMQGEGPGSITGGENAFSAVMGPLASEVLWAGFHGAYSPINVAMNLQIQVWSQKMRLKITGNWDRIFEHFSAAASGRYLWFSADIKAEFNNMRTNGTISVEVDVDGTTPGGDKMEEAINKRIDMIVAQFTEQAKQLIFEPPPPKVEAAEASSGGLLSGLFGFGAGLSLKYRRDTTRLNLGYNETRYFRYLQPNTISSSMQGFFNEIKNDPQAERKYFTRLVLGKIFEKVTRIVKPVANYADPSKAWVGDPVAFMVAQVAYPREDGTLQWKAQSFQPTDPPDANFNPAFILLKPEEVENKPAGWEPDETFVKRSVHLLEPPGETEYPNMRVQVESNIIELDEGPNGTLTNDKILEVRADRAGVLDVGPMLLSALLSSEAELVEVEFKPKGTRRDGSDRSGASVRFRWSFGDQNESRYWRIFTGQPEFVANFDYRVHVTVRGTLFSQGMAWSGPWVSTGGNGPLVVDVPSPGAPGVVTRRLTPRELVSRDVVRVDAPAPGAPGVPTRIEEPSIAASGTGHAATSGGIGAPVSGGGIGAPRAQRSSADRERDDLTVSFAPAPVDSVRDAGTRSEGASDYYAKQVEKLASESRGTARATRTSKGRSSRRQAASEDYGTGGSEDTSEPDAWQVVPANGAV